MARAGTPEERERLSDAYELRYRGEGGPMGSALFGAYLAALVGTVYGSVLAHYVFEEWPQILHWVERQPVAATGLAVLAVLLVAAVAFKVGGARGPVLPEPGHIEFVVATDHDVMTISWLPHQASRSVTRRGRSVATTNSMCPGSGSTGPRAPPTLNATAATSSTTRTARPVAAIGWRSIQCGICGHSWKT